MMGIETKDKNTKNANGFDDIDGNKTVRTLGT